MGPWLPALLAFLGALLGAAVPAWVALRGQRHEKRVEWRQRLDRAIDLAASTDDAQRRIGKLLLVDAIESDLGSEAERNLAYRVARVRMRSDVTLMHTEGEEDA